LLAQASQQGDAQDMARALREDRLTPADELRSLLAESERLLANLRGADLNAVDLLRSMDRISALMPDLEALGVDLRAEGARWEALQAAVHRGAASILRHTRQAGGLKALRRQYYPDGQAAWWWYLDQEVASRTRSRLLRIGAIVLGVAALLIAGSMILRAVFPVDPRVEEAAGKLMEGQSKLQNDADYQGALPLFQDAVTLTPDDSEAWLWLAATQQKLGDQQASAESFRRAQQLTPTETDFHLRRATVYLAVAMLDEALTDANAVIAADPENPEANMILAGVYDARGDYSVALEALQRAAEFADLRNQPQIGATARYQMGMLLQRIPIWPEPSPTPAP
jgi:tetratricopeptide (TPR) repeat protein